MDHLFFYSGVLKISDLGIKRKIDSITNNKFNEKEIKELISPDFEYLKNNSISNCYSYLLKRSKYKLHEDYYTEANKSAMLIKDEFLKFRMPIDFFSHLKTAVSGIDLLFKLLFNKLKDNIC